MTFSILGTDGKSLGVGLVSGSVSVRERVPWIAEEVGAIATQTYTETMYGKQGLELLKQNFEPREALETLLEKDPKPEKRQVGILQKSRKKATHTGDACPKEKDSVKTHNCIGIGNMLQSKKTVSSMINRFQKENEKMSIRILNALETGAENGGDRRGNQTAALLIKGEENLDFGIDKSNTPIQDLRRKVKKEI